MNHYYQKKYLKYKKKYINTKKLHQSGGIGEQNKELTEWADYIIVGAGAAGSVLAGRLAQKFPNDKILILELGPDNQHDPYIENPRDSMLLWNNPDGPQPSPTCLGYRTIIQDKRAYNYPRGNGAGGSTNHHSMIDGRGSYKIYDRIAKLVNDDSWSSENVWKYFKKMESYNVPFADTRFHGQDGWLQVKQFKMTSTLQQNLIFATNQTTGAPIRYDFSGDKHNVAGVGFNDIQINNNGKRSYAFKDLLAPLLASKNNLHILFNTLVTKIILEPTKSNPTKSNPIESNDFPILRAIGVETLNANDHIYSVDCTKINTSKTMKNNSPIIYKARKEIILCGGAINTPQILMLSGIGPRDHLEKIRIPVLLDLPGVGTDLMDHHECSISYEIDPLKYVWPLQASNIIENINHSVPISDQLIKLKKHLEKFAHTEDCAVMFDWYSGFDMNHGTQKIVNDDDPDLHIHSIDGFFYDFDFNRSELLPNGKQRMDYFRSQTHLDKLTSEQNGLHLPQVFHSFLIEVLKFSNATGTIRLASSDPTMAPLIDLGLYRDDQACERMALGIMMMRQIVMHPLLRHHYKLDSEQKPIEIFPGYKYQTLEDLKTYLKSWSAFGHHISGTAKMCDTSGQSLLEAAKKGGVVDSKLCVIGVPNLRVVDTSVYPYPELHGYNTVRAAYVVAEVASDFFK